MKDQIAIRTIEDLNNVRNNLAGDYVLTRDLDFAVASSYASGVVHSDYRPNAANPADATNPGFVPIGTEATPFTGTFYGGGFVIHNLYVRAGGEVGLFGRVDGATIRNVGIEKGYISGVKSEGDFSAAGGLVGEVGNGGTITNCYTTGDVSGSSSYAGGLVGRGSGTITNCYTTGNVSGGNTTGGLIGNVGSTLTITNCYATGNVSGGDTAGGLVGSGYATLTIEKCYATGEVSSGNSLGSAGGLVGVVGDLGGGNFVITNCYATGNVTDGHAGGLVGGVSERSTLTITNCYATGSVSNEGGANCVGGLVGIGNETLNLTNCYATGAVICSSDEEGRSNWGGLVGGVCGGSSKLTFENCYWNSETTGQSTTAGTGGTALTTAELQGLTAEETGWDTNIWDFGTSNDYPTLRVKQ